MKHLIKNITVGMSLSDIRHICEKFMLANGADSFWYYNVGAFVFAGDETSTSVSGREYKTSERVVCSNDIITVDLSPQNNHIWGDFARTIIVENGSVVDKIENIQNAEWQHGLQMECYLHRTLLETATADMTFEELYCCINDIIAKHGFLNLDFLGNLGHSIVKSKKDRVYIEKGNTTKLSEIEMFTFEPHISIPNSKYGYKMEDIYYFKKGNLVKL